MSYEIDLNRWMRISDSESIQSVFPYSPTDDPVVAWNDDTGLRFQRRSGSSDHYLAFRVNKKQEWWISPFPLCLELTQKLDLACERDIRLRHYGTRSQRIDFIVLEDERNLWIALREPPSPAVLKIVRPNFPVHALFFWPKPQGF
jgi:hypothetical protein